MSIFIGTMVGLFFSRTNKDEIIDNFQSSTLKKQLKTFEENKKYSQKIPKSGLPEGWTIEQWNHYGAEYLRKLDQSKKQ